MKKPSIYKQCTLMKPARPGGVFKDVSWIPAKFAKVGKVLSLLKEGEWVDGWEVVAVGGSRDFQYLEEQRTARSYFADKVECKRDRRNEK